MRVNIEDSIKRHLPRLMRTMGWSHREVVGALVCVWGSTQDAEIYEETPERIHTVCAIDFDDDQQCEKFINAMIAAQLISVLEDGRLRIKGNKTHIERLQTLRNNSKAGGTARQAKNSNSFVAVSEPYRSLDGAISEPSLLLTPNTPKITELDQQCADLTRARDFESPARKTKPIEPLVLADLRQLAKQHKRPTPENDTEDDRREAGKLYARFPSQWRTVAEKYFLDPWYGKWGWSLRYLASNADAINGRQDSPAKPQAPDVARQVVPNAEESAKRLAAMKTAPIDPEGAAKARSIVEALSGRLSMDDAL